MLGAIPGLLRPPLVPSNYSEVGHAEVGHRPRYRTYVAIVLRPHQHHADALRGCRLRDVLSDAHHSLEWVLIQEHAESVGATLFVTCDVTCNPVSHPLVVDICELRDKMLVGLEVLGELVRIDFYEPEGPDFDKRRSYIPHPQASRSLTSIGNPSSRVQITLIFLGGCCIPRAQIA